MMLRIIIFALTCAACQLRAATMRELRFAEEPGKTLTLFCGTNLLWTLHFDGPEHKPYFYPLRTPSGVDLAWHRPADHPWHLGLWYSWKYINNANFWDPKEHLPAEPRSGNITIQNIHAEGQTDFSARVTYDLNYQIGDGPRLLAERVTIAISPPSEDGAFWIDWAQTSIAADTPLVFDRTKPASQGGPPWGGYAGLTFRCAPTLTQRRVRDSGGWENTDRLLGHGKPAKWIDLSGVGPDGHAAGVTLMDHPGNQRSPMPWYVYMDGPIGLIKTAFLFNEPFTLAVHEKLSLHYRALVHEGLGDKIALDKEFGRFAAGDAEKPNPFFAYCMEVNDSKKRSLAEQAALLEELGYDGAGHQGLNKVAERIQTLDAAGLKLFQITVNADVSPGKQPYDPHLREVFQLIKGRGVQINLILNGRAPSDTNGDVRAVEILRELSELARDSGTQIVLYPHTGCWLERIEDALRVADKVDRNNVGVMFNLCHWLRVNQDRNYRPALAAAMPRLFAVSINGAEEFYERADWHGYIQPLGRGSFDVCAFLKTLRELGYTGPIGLQCYGIPGDARDSLAQSIHTWRDYWARLAPANSP